MKKLLHVQRSDTPHMVGDGFPTRSVFHYRETGAETSPFLLMDYAGPTEFAPSELDYRKGVSAHPHRGFETVTIVYSGQIEHRDSSGGGGLIGSGDVQWMTAASGLVHEETHSQEFTKSGGKFESIQLWVNLPAKDKMTKPRYQDLKNADIPVLKIEKGGGIIRVIAGELQGLMGPAKTFTPINLWDAKLKAGASINLEMPVGFTTLVFVIDGKIRLNTGDTVGDNEIAFLSRDDKSFSIEAIENSKLLILGGQPLNEPLIGYGPFVMNTSREIQEAMDDYSNGKMGTMGTQAKIQ